MGTKGIDAILSRDKKGSEGTFNELKKGENMKKEKKNGDVYKYFRVVEASFDKKEPVKKNQEAPRSVEAPIQEPPVIEETIEETPVAADMPIYQEKTVEEMSVYQESPVIEELAQEISVEPNYDLEEEIRREAALEEERLAEERRRILMSELEAARAEKMSLSPDASFGTEITKEEADILEAQGNVFRKTVIIHKGVEEVPPEETPEDPLEKELVLKFRKTGMEFPLVNPVYIVGRKPESDIPLIDETYVGRTHAKIIVGDNVVITDLNSKNGTFVNGEKISSAVLSEGDIVTFADVECIVLGRFI